MEATMTNVAHAKKSPVSETTGCPCGWGRHCRCRSSWRYHHDLERAVRELLSSGSDLGKRRRAHATMRELIDLEDQRDRDDKALRKLFDTLPRHKDVDLVRRLMNDDARDDVWTDEQIAEWTRTPLAHVRDLRVRVAAALAGAPLPTPTAWRAPARARVAKNEAKWAARRARRAA
jgi:hypothetical protein